jgi:hypothetical protein
MTATAATIGYGATFGIEGGTPGVYVTVGEVVSITPPGMSRDTVDATHLSSPNSYKEFIAGLAEGGEASITINLVPSTSDVLFASFHAPADNFQIVFPNAVTMSFAGIVTGYQMGDVVPGDKLTATFTVKQTGKATLA